MTQEERNQLINKHIDLAETLARIRKKGIARWIHFEDLRSAALYGLVDAANKFDSLKGCFPKYARYRIIGEMNEHLRREFTRGQGIPISRVQEKLFAPSEEARDSFHDVLESFIHCLPEKGKSIFRWYYLDQLTMREIAARVGVSEASISFQMKRHRQTIRERLSVE